MATRSFPSSELAHRWIIRRVTYVDYVAVNFLCWPLGPWQATRLRVRRCHVWDLTWSGIYFLMANAMYAAFTRSFSVSGIAVAWPSEVEVFANVVNPEVL